MRLLSHWKLWEMLWTCRPQHLQETTHASSHSWFFVLFYICPDMLNWSSDSNTTWSDLPRDGRHWIEDSKLGSLVKIRSSVEGFRPSLNLKSIVANWCLAKIWNIGKRENQRPLDVRAVEVTSNENIFIIDENCRQVLAKPGIRHTRPWSINAPDQQTHLGGKKIKKNVVGSRPILVRRLNSKNLNTSSWTYMRCV